MDGGSHRHGDVDREFTVRREMGPLALETLADRVLLLRREWRKHNDTLDGGADRPAGRGRHIQPVLVTALWIQGGQSDQGPLFLSGYDKSRGQWRFGQHVHGVGQFEFNFNRSPEIIEHDVDRALPGPFLAHADAWFRLSFHVHGFELHRFLGRPVGEMQDAVFIGVLVNVLGHCHRWQQQRGHCQ